ncbi:hypothetical protein LCGC14_0319880 [marine sediment metagenome]|uniref:Uncharacterized protein n=1 Tax=marine sediment metagenome TaxID=412755 RepID=A0A0F9TJJ5_9ZZZZ
MSSKAEFAAAMVEHNEAHPQRSSERHWSMAGFEFNYERRDPKHHWGRFGGGWDYRLGIDVGGSTVIVNLLVASVQITRKDKR